MLGERDLDGARSPTSYRHAMPDLPYTVLTATHPDDDRVRVSNDADLLDRALIHRYLSEESYWSKGVPRDLVDRGIDHSLPFGLYRDAELIGFARVITDHATYGYLADVFIVPAEQGHGLGRWLVEQVLAHPDLARLRRITLATRDAHGLYEHVGFSRSRPDIDMEIRRNADEIYGEPD